MAEFLDVLRSGFDLSGLREFSVEANPEGLDARYAEILAGGGVTRVSLGAQSFSAATLRMLGRRHDADHIRAAAGAVRAAGIRHLGFDLIVAVPGQTPESLDADLDAAIALAPDHVSVYCLTYEDGTGMTGALRRGRLRAATNDEELAFLRQARGRLEAAGLLRYEISNYARAGARCQHNRTYWRNQAHLGVGPGAVAFVDGVRRKNHPVLAEWCGRLEQGLDPAIERERLEPRAAVGETLMMGLRTTVGVSEKRLRFQHACGFEALDTDAIERLRLQGLVVGQPRRMRLTDRGFELADAIAAELL